MIRDSRRWKSRRRTACSSILRESEHSWGSRPNGCTAWPTRGDLAERDHPAARLVPESETQSPQLIPEAASGHIAQGRDPLMAFLEAVVGHARVQVVDVMVSDVAGEPLEDRR